MKLGQMLCQFKTWSEFIVKRIWIVANDIQAAARGWGVRAERCDDNVSAWFDRMRDLAHIRGTIVPIRQKMKDRPVVPYVVFMPTQWKCRHVAAQPMDVTRGVADPIFSATASAVADTSRMVGAR